MYLTIKLLQNIRTIDEGVSGSLDLTMMGELPGFGKVYHHPDGLANILCFHDQAEKKLVTFDEVNNEFVVKIKN